MKTFFEILLQMMIALCVVFSMFGLSFMSASCIVKRIAFKHPIAMALVISIGTMWCIAAAILAIA